MGNSASIYGFQLLEGQVIFCKNDLHLPPRYRQIRETVRPALNNFAWTGI